MRLMMVMVMRASSGPENRAGKRGRSLALSGMQGERRIRNNRLQRRRARRRCIGGVRSRSSAAHGEERGTHEEGASHFALRKPAALQANC
jgi:hypothetical protein